MTDQNFKQVSDDSEVCAVLTENDPCVRYCGNAFMYDEKGLLKLSNPYNPYASFLCFDMIDHLIGTSYMITD